MHPNMTEPAVACAADEVCTVDGETVCFTAPCFPLGDCRPSTGGAGEAAVVDPLAPRRPPPSVAGVDGCRPNAAISVRNCARLTFTFDKNLVPVVSFETTI